MARSREHLLAVSAYRLTRCGNSFTARDHALAAERSRLDLATDRLDLARRCPDRGTRLLGLTSFSLDDAAHRLAVAVDPLAMAMRPLDGGALAERSSPDPESGIGAVLSSESRR